MSRLTLRLPKTLHQQLEALAQQEQVSLNQYIVYALTRQATQSYAVQQVPEELVREQRAAYNTLLQGLGQATAEKIASVLDEREAVESEDGLTPEVVERLWRRISLSD
jgi:hypothetical protein